MMRSLTTLIGLLVLAPIAHGQDLFVFPNDGQSQDQQDMDTFQCQRDATNRTGFDPMATPQASTPAPQQQGGVVGGAARGALLGGAIGAATGNTRQGLRAGAAGGGVLGGMRRADSNRQQEEWARREAANYQRNRDNWNRAFTACMEARGYTVR
jgi:predicted lipid-binding transport protein (Tim44 family)